MNQNYNNKSKIHSEKQVTSVRIEWRRGRDSTDPWNEICVWAMEQFGLPGDKFTWHATESHMDFDFIDEKDAIHFILRWS